MESNNRAEKIFVSFWGTRGSISTPGRITEKYGGNTPCVDIRFGDIQVIFDAGTGIRNLGIELQEEIKSRGEIPKLHIFLSHTHWDHIQGLPFFLPFYNEDVKLTIYGSPHKERFLASILKEQMDYEYFPVSMAEFSADINIKEMTEDIIDFGSITLDWEEQIFHPGGSVRYRVNLNGKKIIYATDVELNLAIDSKKNNNGKALLDQYMDFINNAELLIADAQYTEEEYIEKVGWGHTSVPFLLNTAHEACVKQVAIFHHDPQHSDNFLDELWLENRKKYQSGKKKMDVFWAREGMTLSF